MDVLSLGTSWNDFMLPAAIRATVVLLCTGAVAWLVWSQSARLRSLVWTAGLVSALLIPLAPYQPVSVSIGTPALPAFLDRDRSNEQQPIPSTPDAAAEPSPVERLASEVPLSLDSPDPSATLSIPLEPVDVVSRVADSLGLIWLAGVVLLLARMLGGCAWHTVRTRRLQVVAEGPWLEEAGRIRAELGIRRRVRLLAGDTGCAPQTWGLLNPAVLIPAADALDAESREAVLRHELAHIARYDALWLPLERLLTALYWWNPLFWLAARRAHLAREQSCDDVVLERGGRPSDYANQLLVQAHGLLRRPNPEFPSLLPRSDAHLKRRISRILDPEARRQAPPAALVATLLLALILTACGASALGLQSEFDEPEETFLSTDMGTDVTRSTDGVGIEIHDDSGSLTATIEGEVALGSDDELASLSPGGMLTISDERGAVTHGMIVEAGASGLVYTYFVDGAEARLDDAGQAWFDATLLELIRASGIAAEARVARLYQQGGSEALLDEVGRIPSDVVRSIYLRVALDQAVSDAGGRSAILASLERLVGTEFERSLVLMETGPEELAADAGSRDALLLAISSLDGSPVEQALALEQVFPSLADSEADLAAAIEIAADIRTDFERAHALNAAAPTVTDAGPALDAWLDGVNGIESEFDRARTLGALLGGPETTAAFRIQAIAAAAGIGADFEKTELLVTVAASFRGSESERAAYRATAMTIGSEFDRGRALAALES